MRQLRLVLGGHKCGSTCSQMHVQNAGYSQPSQGTALHIIMIGLTIGIRVCGITPATKSASLSILLIIVRYRFTQNIEYRRYKSAADRARPSWKID